MTRQLAPTQPASGVAKLRNSRLARALRLGCEPRDHELLDPDLFRGSLTDRIELALAAMSERSELRHKPLSVLNIDPPLSMPAVLRR